VEAFEECETCEAAIEAHPLKRGHKEVWKKHAVLYDLLVSRHDNPTILAEIQTAAPLRNNMVVLEVGCGSGRLSRLLAPHVGRVEGFDSSEHMVECARDMCDKMGVKNCVFDTADNRGVRRRRRRAD